MSHKNYRLSTHCPHSITHFTTTNFICFRTHLVHQKTYHNNTITKIHGETLAKYIRRNKYQHNTSLESFACGTKQRQNQCRK